MIPVERQRVNSAPHHHQRSVFSFAMETSNQRRNGNTNKSSMRISQEGEREAGLSGNKTETKSDIMSVMWLVGFLIMLHL